MSGTEKIRTIATPLKQRKEKREQKKDNKRKNYKPSNNTCIDGKMV